VSDDLMSLNRHFMKNGNPMPELTSTPCRSWALTPINEFKLWNYGFYILIWVM
jgi:hypothetical protein